MPVFFTVDKWSLICTQECSGTEKRKQSLLSRAQGRRRAVRGCTVCADVACLWRSVSSCLSGCKWKVIISLHTASVHILYMEMRRLDNWTSYSNDLACEQNWKRVGKKNFFYGRWSDQLAVLLALTLPLPVFPLCWWDCRQLGKSGRRNRHMSTNLSYQVAWFRCCRKRLDISWSSHQQCCV